MRLPKNWSQITVEQFQECYFLLGKTPTIDTWLMVLSTLSGETQKHLESIPVRELKTYISKLDFILTPNENNKINKYISFGGRPFKACLDAGQMQTNQVADLKAFMVGDGQPVNDTIVENAHKLLACIYVPLTTTGFKYVPGKHKETAEKFKKAKMGDVYGVVFFYSVVYKNLMETTKAFGKENLEIVLEHQKKLEEWSKTLRLDGAGR